MEVREPNDTLIVTHRRHEKHHTTAEVGESSRKAKKDKKSRAGKRDVERDIETKDEEEKNKKREKKTGEKQKKHKRVLVEDDENQIDSVGMAPKASKKGKEKDYAAVIEKETEVAPVQDGKRSGEKKRKRHAEEIEGAEEPQPKKKSKNKTGLLDPQEDSSLSEQARKALMYAFTQFRRPKKWKFHKARQNWIIRNVWSTENVPDSQMPLVLKYLSNVQGGVRENLVKTCQSTIETCKAGDKSSESSTPLVSADETQTNHLQSDDIKSKRALALLSVLTDSKEDSDPISAPQKFS